GPDRERRKEHRMNAGQVVGDQLSAASQSRRDALANAHCLHCGYSLRGLPENRCPECGTAFDPADFADAFLPLWPQLFMWYLIAIVVRSLTELPRTIDLLSSLATTLTTQTHLHNAAIDVTSCLMGIAVPA